MSWHDREAMIALWEAAFKAFEAASNATRIGDMPGNGFDRAHRIWIDFEKIINYLNEPLLEVDNE